MQGWSLGTILRFNQQQHLKNEYNEYRIESKLDYGFEEKVFRPSLSFTQRFNEFRKAEFTFKTGIELEAYDHNPSSSSFRKLQICGLKNYNKYYENRMIGLNYKQYIAYDFYGLASGITMPGII